MYSRVVGYLRPVAQWNDGKKEEFGQRKTFRVEKAVPSEELVKNQVYKIQLQSPPSVGCVQEEEEGLPRQI